MTDRNQFIASCSQATSNSYVSGMLASKYPEMFSPSALPPENSPCNCSPTLESSFTLSSAVSFAEQFTRTPIQKIVLANVFSKRSDHKIFQNLFPEESDQKNWIVFDKAAPIQPKSQSSEGSECKSVLTEESEEAQPRRGKKRVEKPAKKLRQEPNKKTFAKEAQEDLSTSFLSNSDQKSCHNSNSLAESPAAPLLQQESSHFDRELSGPFSSKELDELFIKGNFNEKTLFKHRFQEEPEAFLLLARRYFKKVLSGKLEITEKQKSLPVKVIKFKRGEMPARKTINRESFRNKGREQIVGNAKGQFGLALFERSDLSLSDEGEENEERRRRSADPVS